MQFLDDKRKCDLLLTELGEYPLICAELCGAYHGAMNTKVVVESAEDVQKWLQSQQVASAEGLSKAVATTPANMTEPEYLAPYAKAVGDQR